jgi:hypothetical protein
VSAIQHAAVMRKGGYAALCGIHRKRTDWEGFIGQPEKVDCRKCLAKLANPKAKTARPSGGQQQDAAKGATGQ